MFAVRTTGVPIHQYAVGFLDENTTLKLKGNILSRFLLENFGSQKDSILWDGSSIFTINRIDALVGRHEVTIPMNEGDRPAVWKMDITFLRTIVPATGTHGGGAGEMMPEQPLNIVLARALRKVAGLKKIDRKYFRIETPLPLDPYVERSMEILPGFSSRILHRERGFILQIDIAHKVFSKETFLNRIRMVESQFRGNRRDVKRLQEHVNEALAGTSVSTCYSHAHYTAVEIDYKKSPNDEFQLDDGKMIRFADYFATVWRKAITDPTQPMVKAHRGRRVIYLPPELLNLTGGALDSSLRQNLPKICSVHAMPRTARTLEILDDIGQEGRAVLAQWGVQIEPQLMQFEKHVIPDQKLKFYGSPAMTVSAERGWNNEMSRVTYQGMGASFNNWIVLFRDSPGAHHAKEAFLNRMQTMSQEMRIHFEPPRGVFPVPQGQSFTSVLKQTGKMPTFIVFVFDHTGPDYDECKRVTLSAGIPSQGILASKHLGGRKNVDDPHYLTTICNKLLIQMQCKMGIHPYTMDLFDPSEARRPPLTFFVGVDVYHGARQFDRVNQKFGQRQSVIAFSGMYYRSNTAIKFVSSHSLHRPRQEVDDIVRDESGAIGGALGGFVRNAAKQFGVPDLLVVYRDGVGEGEFEMVQAQELRQVQAAFVGAPKTPKIVYMCLLKKNPTRFMWKTPQGVVNPPAGTVIRDDRITADRRFPEFYLLPSSCNLSTSRPVRYVILHNDSPFQQAQLEILTFQMCHFYSGWAGTVKVPSVTFHAHKLAYHIGEHLSADAQINYATLRDRLFFL